MRRAIDPLLQLIRPIPVTAWVPISMMWFGIGDNAAIYLIVLATFFPIYLNTMQGVQYVDKVIIRAGRMLGARGWRLLVYVVLPAALPSIFAGLRISVGFAWMAVVVSELVAVKNGLGYVMFDAYGFLRADIVVAAMVVIGVLGFVCDRLMVSLERRDARLGAQCAGGLERDLCIANRRTERQHFIAFDRVSKTYATPARRGDRASRDVSDPRSRRVRLHRRAERLRQDDAAQHAGRLRHAVDRHR